MLALRSGFENRKNSCLIPQHFGRERFDLYETTSQKACPFYVYKIIFFFYQSSLCFGTDVQTIACLFQSIYCFDAGKSKDLYWVRAQSSVGTSNQQYSNALT